MLQEVFFLFFFLRLRKFKSLHNCWYLAAFYGVIKTERFKFDIKYIDHNFELVYKPSEWPLAVL